MLLEEHGDLIIKMLKTGVEFIVVGGYAVIYHGYGRTTGDLDLWLKPDNNNKEKLLLALDDFGILQEDLNRLKNMDFTQTVAFYIGHPPVRIDFMTKLSGLHFDVADVSKVFFSYRDFKVPVLNYDLLIQNKMNSGRTQDKADVEELQKISIFKKNSDIR